jgi:hypothetical protein
MSFSESTARWAVSLKGENIDVADARALFGQHGNVRVRTIQTFSGQEKTALISDDFENMSDEFQVHQAAERILALVNGILFVGDASRAPIQIDGVHRRAENGHWLGAAQFAAATFKGRSHVRAEASLSGDSPPPSAPRETIWLREATQNDIVADVLTFLRGEPDWFDLAKAFERMRSDINAQVGQHNESTVGWPDTNHFRQSAQVYRHSKAKWPPGYSLANAMKVSEARDFVRTLTRAWLDWRYPT